MALLRTNVVFPSQLSHLHQRYPEVKSLAPGGTPCTAVTEGLLKRAHVIAGEIRYIGRKQIANGRKAKTLACSNSLRPSMEEGQVVASEECHIGDRHKQVCSRK